MQCYTHQTFLRGKTMGFTILLGVLAAVAIYAVIVYNNLVRIKHNVSKAWSNIDVLLKQRHDELGKLVETCKQYADFEQKTLQRVVEARSAVAAAREAGDIGALGAAEGALRLGLGNLFAVAEAYPELRTSETFRHLQDRISGLENTIADRRSVYNEAVNINNIRVEQFPDVFIARFFGFGPRELLEFDEAETRDVNLKEMFGD